MTETSIELCGISKSYDSRHVLTGLDLLVPKGSVRAVGDQRGRQDNVGQVAGADPAAIGDCPLAREDAWTLTPGPRCGSVTCRRSSRSIRR